VVGSSGTRIDLGLATARVKLTGARHRPGHGSVIVLLSDGIQSSGSTGLVDPEAEAAGIVVSTIGLGADAELLRRIASSPSHAYVAPTGVDLASIYRRIAVAIPYPASEVPPAIPEFWIHLPIAHRDR